MITSARQYLISDVLKPDADVKYVVPKYQRECIWGRDDWENLFDDIWFNDDGYFLGSIICINRSDDAFQPQELEVVDGQQRLITLSLFYAAIYAWLRGQPNPSDELGHELYNLKFRLVLKSAGSHVRVEPSYQRQNYQDYRSALMEAGILSDEEVPPHAGNRRIYKTYNYFLGRLSEMDENGHAVFDLDKVLHLLNKVSRACVVKIEVSRHSDAFTLFESLNNRGVPLSALDLIKNKLLATLEKKGIATIDENFKRWNRLLENLSEEYSTQERYLRQYYNAFKFEEATSVPNVTLATRSNIIHIYEKLIDRDARIVFDGLSSRSKLYNRLINAGSEENSPELAGCLRDLDRIGGATSYTLLLYLLALQNEDCLADVAGFLVKYFVRRNLTDIPPTRDLDRLFINLIQEIQSNGGKPVSENVRRFLTQAVRVASDEEFRAKLEGNIYDENAGVTRFILCKIEESHQTRETMTDLWERDDKGGFIWTIEHVFPQGPNIPSSWVNMIADGDPTKAQEHQEKHVHRLGNLTITGYNSKLGSKSFLEKRDRKDIRGKLVGYRNGLFLNRTLQEKDTWHVQDIEERTSELVKWAKELFSLD